MEIKKLVKKLKRKYKTNDPYELASYLNVAVMYEYLGHIKGFYQMCPKNKIIHINCELNKKDKLVVCSHELGHALLHAHLNILFLEHNTFCVKNRYENEANKFAAELLINDCIFEQYPGFSIEQIASIEGLPVELIKLKFK